MVTKSANIVKLLEILNSLNNVIKHYAIYLYLIDSEFNLIWYNYYTRDKFHLNNSATNSTCYRAFWGYDHPCEECPNSQEDIPQGIQRTILQRRLPGDEQTSFLEIISLPVINEEQKIEAFLKIGLDVTSIEKKQRDLWEKEKLLISIIDSSSDGILMLDADDNIVSWNQGAQDIFGYTPPEIIGKSVITMIPKELIELGEVYYIRKELSEKGYIRNYETQRLHKSGRLIHVDLISSLLHNEKDEVMGRSVMVKDISARKELEIELRRTIQELSKLNELNEILYATNVLDDILRIILIAVTAGEGLKFNRAFLVLKDSSTKVLKGHIAIGPANEIEAHRIWMTLQKKVRSLKDIINEYEVNLPGSDKEINELVRNIIVPLDNENNILVNALNKRLSYHVVQGDIPGGENLTLNLDGTNLVSLLGYDTFLVIPLFTKKEPLGVMITDNKFTRRDISEEDIDTLRLFANQASMAIENAMLYDRLEEQIAELQVAYKKLETNADRLVRAERLAAIGKVAASVAHEIRNPLVSIGGFARLLERKMPQNEDMKQYTSIIISQVDHLESILNNILGIASPRKPHFRSFDLHRVIHQVLMMMDELFQRRNIQLDLQLNCRESLVKGDEKQIFQAILNVIKNAVEAMSKVCTLTIRTACDRDFVHVRIRDTGKGIPRTDLAKIYDPFFTTKSEGTGLGLAVVRQIVKDHKGRINISSTVDKGTIVNIDIPRSRAGMDTNSDN
jgi:PAS domain S-box-containing protein